MFNIQLIMYTAITSNINSRIIRRKQICKHPASSNYIFVQPLITVQNIGQLLNIEACTTCNFTFCSQN